MPQQVAAATLIDPGLRQIAAQLATEPIRAQRRALRRDEELLGARLVRNEAAPHDLDVEPDSEQGPLLDRDVAVLKANELTGSMGRVSSAGDNAAMESFYSLLQKYVLDRKRWATRDELATAIVIWIEHTYNNRRRQRGLGKLTPSSSSWRSPTETSEPPEGQDRQLNLQQTQFSTGSAR